MHISSSEIANRIRQKQQSLELAASRKNLTQNINDEVRD
jgi:hypothetical protein